MHWQMNRFSGDGNILGIALGKKPTSWIIMVPHRQPGSQRSPYYLLPGMYLKMGFSKTPSHSNSTPYVGGFLSFILPGRDFWRADASISLSCWKNIVRVKDLFPKLSYLDQDGQVLDLVSIWALEKCLCGLSARNRSCEQLVCFVLWMLWILSLMFPISDWPKRSTEPTHLVAFVVA